MLVVVRRRRRPRSRQAPADGRAPRRLADVAIVTSDNPRSEDPDAIIDEIAAGMAGGATVERIADRRAAIERAVGAGAARATSWSIAGKGHEQGQEFAGGAKVPFDDVDGRAGGAACARWSR